MKQLVKTITISFCGLSLLACERTVDIGEREIGYVVEAQLLKKTVEGPATLNFSVPLENVLITKKTHTLIIPYFGNEVVLSLLVIDPEAFYRDFLSDYARVGKIAVEWQQDTVGGERSGYLKLLEKRLARSGLEVRYKTQE